MTTLLLDQTAWDLVLDASGNIAVASSSYATAQDVASAVRTFAGECWYDTSVGVPYWTQVLGQYPPVQYVQQVLTDAAQTVPDVVGAQMVFTDLTGRVPQGQLQVVDVNNTALGVTLS